MAKTQAEKRVKRVPVGGPRDILAVADQDPNFVYRWVNDTRGRLQKFLDAGYEVVNQDLEVGQNAVDRGTKVGSAVTRAVGSGTTAVLMRIPREWYNEDQAAKAKENDAVESAMRKKAKGESDYGSLTITRK